MKHILTSAQFERMELEDIFERTAHFKESHLDYTKRKQLAGKYIGMQLCTLFYQPSTRTRLSFEAAANRFGMGVLSTENAKDFSSAAKGETLEDTIKVINGYADIIVLRHHVNGSAMSAAQVSEVPIINAGDGSNEHPTQAVLDIYTIKEMLGRTDNLNIVYGGDLRFGRTVRSSIDLLTRVYKGNEFTFIAPDDLQISPDIEARLIEQGIKYKKTTDMADGLANADVVYWTRLQLENLEDEDEIERINAAIKSGSFNITPESLKMMPVSAIILHPLPRVGEIDPRVDLSPQAAYFDQARNGLPVRQVLVDKIMKSVYVGYAEAA